MTKDISCLSSPCKNCKHKKLDKNKVPCSLCRDRYAYDALLCGKTREEFESWFLTISDELFLSIQEETIYRCIEKDCYRRTDRKGTRCMRCHRSKGRARNLETKQEIVEMEIVIYKFINFCETCFDNLLIAAKEFGVNPAYIYQIRSFDFYPSKSMLFAMNAFMKSYHV